MRGTFTPIYRVKVPLMRVRSGETGRARAGLGGTAVRRRSAGDADVAFVDDAEADEGEPGLVYVDPVRLIDHDRGEPTGGHHRHLVGVVGELDGDPFDETVDLTGEAVQDPGLQRLDGVLADHSARAYQLDLPQLRAARAEGIDGDLNARRDGTAEQLTPCR